MKKENEFKEDYKLLTCNYGIETSQNLRCVKKQEN